MISDGSSSGQRRRLDDLLRLPENRECCDCSAKQPRWASTNLGVFFCLRCAGLHRALGTHVSKVKSTTMDTWEDSMIRCCECIGNERGRHLYEHALPPEVKPTPHSDNAAVERFIRAKYERRLYLHPQYDAMLSTFLRAPPQPAASKAVAMDRAPRGDERSASIGPKPDAMPMLWDATSTPPPPPPPALPQAPVQAANGHVSSTGLVVDELFAPASHPQHQQKQHMQRAAPGDVKSEIMALFANPPTTHEHSAHVYSAWEPRKVQRY